MNKSVNELCRRDFYNLADPIAPIAPRGADLSSQIQGVQMPKGVAQPTLDIPKKESAWSKIGDWFKSGKATETLTQAQQLASQIGRGRGRGGTGVDASVGAGSDTQGGGGGGKKGSGMKPMTYVYIGLGVVAIGTIAYFAFRKK